MTTRGAEYVALMDVLVSQCAIIAELPLEDWDAAFDRAELACPILDPTLYRDYLYDRNAKLQRELIKAAIEVKRVMQSVRECPPRKAKP